tara:strand:+ start:977 stop:1201 length:225 start_codon:yes stop_codon:yes gene_type:complete
MFVDNIVEKHWLSVDGKTVFSTKYVGRSFGEVTSIDRFTHPNLEIKGVFKIPSIGIHVQVHDTKTNKIYWYIVA